MSKILGWFAILCVVASASACASYTQENYIRQPGYAASGPSVAVMPFTNLTNYPNAGQIVADVMSSVLYEAGSFVVMSKEEQKTRAGDLQALTSGVSSEHMAREIGQKLGVSAVIFGSVSEYRYKQGLTESPTVGVNLRMVDVKTGEIVWAASHTLTRGVSLNANTQRVCEKMANTFLNAKAPVETERD